MIFQNAFTELDSYLKQNLNTVTCDELFKLKKDFYGMFDSLSNNTANLTGFTELIIFRYLYHAFNMTGEVINRTVHNGDTSISIGKRFNGKNGKYQEPDIVVEQDGRIEYLFSIKNILSTVAPTENEKRSKLVQQLIKTNGVCTVAIQDIFRIDNIRHDKHEDFKSITVVFSEIAPRHQRAVELIRGQFEWHRFLVLENNHKPFVKELEDILNLKI
ncbi:hypothetical protein ACFFHF_16370 [Robertmurraya beringensis]|uniref:Restriction endonuclease n=1 Tax=Robertmurraya beringensis TaxID=641660 RepID=A0ABV6KTZ2_9BACI